jgi:tight adherence protein B
MLDVYYTYLISFLVFIAAIIFLEGMYLLWRAFMDEGLIKINKRLRALSAGGESHRKALNLIRRQEMSSIPLLNRMLIAIPRLHALDRLLEQAAVNLSVSRFLGIQLLFAVLLTLLFSLLANLNMVLVLLLAIPLAGFIPVLVLLKMKQKRGLLFSRQLPDALDYIARSLRAGNPLTASLRSVATEMPDPTGTEFGITFEELNYGLAFEEALHNLAHRSGSDEMNYFVTAVLIQRTTGGNLADMLNKLATIMRARASTYREIGILSAEMKLSANVLIALPIFVALILLILNPDYLSVLFTTTFGQIMVFVQLVLMAIGYAIIRKMINLRV